MTPSARLSKDASARLRLASASARLDASDEDASQLTDNRRTMPTI